MSGSRRKSTDGGDHAYKSLHGTRLKVPLRPTYSCPSKSMKRSLRTSRSCPLSALQTSEVKEEVLHEEITSGHTPVTTQPQPHHIVHIPPPTLPRSLEPSQGTSGGYEEEVEGRDCCWCSFLCCLHSLLHHCVWEDDNGYQRLSLRSLCRCERTCRQNVNKSLVLTLCLPFVPCLFVNALYRLLFK